MMKIVIRAVRPRRWLKHGDRHEGAPPQKLFNRVDRQPLIDPSDESGDKLAAVKGEIEVRDVHFAYPTRPDAPVCNGSA